MLLLDLRIFSLQRVGGISVVWAEYLERLKARTTMEVTLLLPATDNEIARQCDFSDYAIQRVAGRNALTKYLPYLRRGRPSEVLHTSYYQWYPFFRGTKIVTLHDFMHEMYAPLKVRLLHNVLKYLSLRSADVILCISEATRSDLQRFYPKLHSSKVVHVIRNAASNEYYPVPSQSRSGENGRYLLWVAGRGGYKNFSYALDALAHLKRSGEDFELRVVGGELSEHEREAASSRGVLEQIRIFSGLTTKQLRTMYSDAFALLYLSKYEGFGLPILEAQQCGCPVIVLDNPSSQEVGDLSVLVLDDSDVEGIGELIELLSDDTHRQTLVRAGYENTKRFSWDDSVEQLIEVYRTSLTGDSGGNQ